MLRQILAQLFIRVEFRQNHWNIDDFSITTKRTVFINWYFSYLYQKLLIFQHLFTKILKINILIQSVK